MIRDIGAEYRQNDVARVKEDAVVLDDGTALPCDAIVNCTGFSMDFPFFAQYHPDLYIRARNNRSLFKRLIVPEWGSSLAFCGLCATWLILKPKGIITEMRESCSNAERRNK